MNTYQNNHKSENQVILLIITDGKKWHYLAVKCLSALFRGIISKHDGDFYCLNCFHSYNTKKKLKKHERVCYDHGYCYAEMPNEDNKILKYNHEKMYSCQNNPKKSCAEKKIRHAPFGYSLFTSCSFDPTKKQT